MDTKYKSSKFITYLQYIISPIIFGFCLYGFYLYFSPTNLKESLPAYYLPIMFWIMIVLVINIIKLRFIKVNENNIIIKNINHEKIVDYKDIIWVNQNLIGSNWYIVTIKYHSSEDNKSKIIYMLPEMYSSNENVSIFKIGQELNIVKYIREQIIKANPAYQVENEPSRWYLVKWIFLSLVPFLLVSLFLLK